LSVMRIRQLLAGLLLALSGALIAWNLFDTHIEQKPVADVSQPAPKFQIVNAVKPLTRGSVIHPDDIALNETVIAPKPGTVTTMADAIERAVMRNITPGETISDLNTAATPKGVRLSELVPPGLRAIAIKVTDETSVANLVQPSDRVDVLLVSSAAHAPQPGSQLFPSVETVTVLQNVPVLAVGDTIIGGGSGKPANRNVTLAVTPEQAAMVAMLGTLGTGYLTLRSKSDETEHAIATMSTNDLRPRQVQNTLPEPPRVRNTRSRSIEIIAGNSANTSRITLERGN
jgi:pilus assembly protein CpaB